jgi:hypothetical protein
MNHATFRFHGELGFFLPRRLRSEIINHPFDWRASIKDMIESLGPPHCEIELIVVNGTAVDFGYIVGPDDRFEVYSHWQDADITTDIRLRPPLPCPPRFVLDTHLGRLAAYLRMMGFDTLYRNDYPDDELAQISADEDRVLLTRDVGVLKRSLVTYGYYVRETQPRLQLAEIVRRFDLNGSAVPFKHCMKCNGLLEPVEKATIIDILPPDTVRYYDDFHRCAACGRIFWKGSHYQKMQRLLDDLLAKI